MAGEAQPLLKQGPPAFRQAFGCGAVEPGVVIGDAQQRQGQIPSRHPRLQHGRAATAGGHLHLQAAGIPQQTQLVAVASALAAAQEKLIQDEFPEAFRLRAHLLCAVQQFEVALNHPGPLPRIRPGRTRHHRRGHGEHRDAEDAHFGAVEAAAVAHFSSLLGPGRRGLGGGRGRRGGREGGLAQQPSQQHPQQQHREQHHPQQSALEWSPRDRHGEGG